MKVNYYCEKCGRNFNNQDQCIKHENNCGLKKPVKLICLNTSIQQNHHYIGIYTYPNAIIYGDTIKFFPSNHITEIYLNRLSLDRIKKYDTRYVIHTYNMDKEYEKECIKKLLDYKKEELKKSLQEYENVINKNIEQIDKNNYQIEINEDFNMIIQDEMDY